MHLLGEIAILNPVFELTGFKKINDKILKQSVVSRICQPLSKVATVDYSGLFEHTRKILRGETGLVFYDVTTLLVNCIVGIGKSLGCRIDKVRRKTVKVWKNEIFQIIITFPL